MRPRRSALLSLFPLLMCQIAMGDAAPLKQPGDVPHRTVFHQTLRPVDDPKLGWLTATPGSVSPPLRYRGRTQGNSRSESFLLPKRDLANGFVYGLGVAHLDRAASGLTPSSATSRTPNTLRQRRGTHSLRAAAQRSLG